MAFIDQFKLASRVETLERDFRRFVEARHPRAEESLNISGDSDFVYAIPTDVWDLAVEHKKAFQTPLSIAEIAYLLEPSRVERRPQPQVALRHIGSLYDLRDALVTHTPYDRVSALEVLDSLLNLTGPTK
jgi:hypothetical protein